MSYLELSTLRKSYGAHLAVKDISLAVEKGEAVAFLGSSGCGKTTTLRMIAGLATPDSGQIKLDGRDITRQPIHQRNLGYVFQSYALFPHLDVFRNVAFGLDERGVSKAERDREVAEVFSLVRLSGLEKRIPRELSAGQQQRVAFARALVIRPSLLMLDASLSNLDTKVRETLRVEIREIQQTLGMTMLFVTHDQVEALTMCDRIAVMEEGRIAQVGTPTEIYENPATRFVANFIGRSNILPVERTGDGAVVLAGHRIGGAPLRGQLDLFVRPQRIRLMSARESIGEDSVRLAGRVVRKSFTGDHVELHVEIDAKGQRLIVESPADCPAPGQGEVVTVGWRNADSRFFEREAA
ncbi:ABC transporter ATP-binding protein [Ensifer sp. ENS12]|uniref:ABC transporter ATP-binding protein n=1 Tax=Ensifer sp. ENS12 TaxID=2854774 RepID=UPI001C465E76|nr:ABC transporter ATP-binding protein [Ensifer sp. ENS12]MBV7518983.1 ABC transporter ATP-binding protein [Ensifer sp. ENS12]